MATGIQAKDDYDLRQKLHFLKRLRNSTIANKIGRTAEFKDYSNYSLAMCFGKALEMEGEFQVGEKCITPSGASVMEIDMGQMTDVEICQLARTDTPTSPQPSQRFNPNPGWKFGVAGHKALECPQ